MNLSWTVFLLVSQYLPGKFQTSDKDKILSSTTCPNLSKSVSVLLSHIFLLEKANEIISCVFNISHSFRVKLVKTPVSFSEIWCSDLLLSPTGRLFNWRITVWNAECESLTTSLWFDCFVWFSLFRLLKKKISENVSGNKKRGENGKWLKCVEK